ncbi:MAG TPA: glycosyltransferase family 4 protein [Thermoguttaceae bacterium]|nr:glycosyltransferase family 4 protein [Thermoguttaceae bacterium]
MKIIHLVAGAGGMYCGSCLQGNTLCGALRQAGHDVLMVPVYTPVRTDEPNVGERRVAMGGLNVFLQQQSSLFRRAPRFVDRLLDHPGLLGRLGGATRPERLGRLTVSMLRGEQGNQRKELDKLVAWLAAEGRPDVIHLSTALLVGAARTLSERLGAPVVATLAGEDSFVERLHEPHRTEAREELRARCAELAGLIAPSAYYAEFMANYLGLPAERITVIRPGLNLEGHAIPGRRTSVGAEAEAAREEEPSTEELPGDEPPDDEPAGDETTGDEPRTGREDVITVEPEPVVPERRAVRVGYFSRICPTKGLHQLIEAFRVLLRDPTLPPVRLVAAGHLGRGDRGYYRQIRRHLARRGLAAWFEYRGELDRPGKIAFLQSIDVLCIPATRPESRGLAVLEGWANGAPAVLPDHGVYSELVAETGGGLLYEPNRPTALAAALERMIRNPALAERYGRQAQETVHREFDARRAAERMIEVYRKCEV